MQHVHTSVCPVVGQVHTEDKTNPRGERLAFDIDRARDVT